MKFFNRIKSAFYALTHDTTTISLLDERDLDAVRQYTEQ